MVLSLSLFGWSKITAFKANLRSRKYSLEIQMHPTCLIVGGVEEAAHGYTVGGTNLYYSNSITEEGGVGASNASLAPGQILITIQAEVSFLLVADGN